MELKGFVTGPLSTSVYVLSDKGEACLIDCGGDPSEILEYIKNKKLNLKYIFLTHGHGDHIYGIGGIRDKTGAKIGLHEKDVIGLNHAFNLSLTNADPVKEDFTLKEGDRFKIGDLVIKVLETPGHTPGGVCYYLVKEKIMFTGDTLFKHGVGRSDFPGGSWGRLKKSLSRLANMDEDIRIFPGHGQDSLIGVEKKFLARSDIQ